MIKILIQSNTPLIPNSRIEFQRNVKIKLGRIKDTSVVKFTDSFNLKNHTFFLQVVILVSICSQENEVVFFI